MSRNCTIRTARPVAGWRGCIDTRWGQIDAVRWSMLALVVALVIWGLTDVRRRGRVDPLHPEVHKTDLTVYTIAGEAMFYGGDPYTISNSRGWKYIYPPPFALLVAPLGMLDPKNQVVVWFAVSVLLGWGCYHECTRIAGFVLPGDSPRGVFGPIPTWIGFAAIAAAALPALNCLQRGQMGVAVLYFLLAGFRMLMESRSASRALLAGAVLAIPVALKATPLLPVTFVLAQQALAVWHSPRHGTERVRAVFGTGGWLLGLAVLLLCMPALLIGWEANLNHLGTWWNTVAMHEESALDEDFAGDNSSERNQSLTNAAHRFGNWIAGHPEPGADESPLLVPATGGALPMDAPLVTILLLGARGAVGCLLLAVGYRTARAHDPLGQTVGFCVAYLATLIVCQIARGHYFVIWLPTILFASTWLVRQRRPRAATWLAIAPVMLVVIHYAFLNQAGRIGILGLGTTAWYTAMCVLLLRKPSGTGATTAIADETLALSNAA